MSNGAAKRDCLGYYDVMERRLSEIREDVKTPDVDGVASCPHQVCASLYIPWGLSSAGFSFMHSSSLSCIHTRALHSTAWYIIKGISAELSTSPSSV